MKTLLYSKSLDLISKSGIGEAIRHQEQVLEYANIPYTTDSNEDYDIVHLNTVFPNSLLMSKQAKRENKKVVYYAHSTMEDFKNSFIGSNLLAPLFKKWITYCYNSGDIIITPTHYSKELLKTYHLKRPIYDLSNGIDTDFFTYNKNDRVRFRARYNIDESDKVVMSVGHYIERKGIIDFVELAKKMPDIDFYWFGYTSLKMVPQKIRGAVKTVLPNLFFPGYIDRVELKEAYSGCDLFLFLTYEETEGIVLLEALASEIPVLLRDISIYKIFSTDKKVVYKADDFKSFQKKPS